MLLACRGVMFLIIELHKPFSFWAAASICSKLVAMAVVVSPLGCFCQSSDLISKRLVMFVGEHSATNSIRWPKGFLHDFVGSLTSPRIDFKEGADVWSRLGRVLLGLFCRLFAKIQHMHEQSISWCRMWHFSLGVRDRSFLVLSLEMRYVDVYCGRRMRRLRIRVAFVRHGVGVLRWCWEEVPDLGDDDPRIFFVFWLV